MKAWVVSGVVFLIMPAIGAYAESRLSSFQSGGVSCSYISCEPTDNGISCGCGLRETGWSELARCDDGHQWSYLLEKDGRKLRCQGINARGGPQEDPCAPVVMSAKEFGQVDTKDTACGRIKKGKTP